MKIRLSYTRENENSDPKFVSYFARNEATGDHFLATLAHPGARNVSIVHIGDSSSGIQLVDIGTSRPNFLEFYKDSNFSCPIKEILKGKLEYDKKGWKFVTLDGVTFQADKDTDELNISCSRIPSPDAGYVPEYVGQIHRALLDFQQRDDEYVADSELYAL